MMEETVQNLVPWYREKERTRATGIGKGGIELIKEKLNKGSFIKLLTRKGKCSCECLRKILQGNRRERVIRRPSTSEYQATSLEID